MPVTEVHEGLGSITLNLRQADPTKGLAGTPTAIRDLITPFSAIVITPTHLGPAGTVSDADLLALANYSGIITARSNERCTWTGWGPAGLLGDPDGKAVLYLTTTTPTDTIANYVANDIADASHGNGITPGDITASATTYTTQIKAGTTPRALLNYLCDRAGMQWRINPDFTLDVDTMANLWPTATTPTLIVRKGGGGRDLNITGWNADVDVTTDWDDYTTYIEVEPTSGSNGTASLSPATTYYAPDGTLIVWRRYITSTRATGTGAANGIAASQLGRFDEPRHHITLDPTVYDIARDVQVGDTINIEDIPNGLYDLTREVYYRGEVCHPTTARIMAMTWKIQQGMGVYLRASDSANTITDLTPYVEWEEGPATVEVNATRRTVLDI